MLESKIREVVEANGNKIFVDKIESDPNEDLACYYELPGFDGEKTHVIEIQKHLNGQEEIDAKLHEFGHIYLRELGYDYSTLISLFPLNGNKQLVNQLVNLFDHWMLVKLITEDGKTNNLFFNNLQSGVKRNCLDDPEEYDDVSILLCKALGILDLAIHRPDVFSLDEIQSQGLKKLYEQIYPLKSVLVFTADIDVECEQFRQKYLQQIEVFLKKLMVILA